MPSATAWIVGASAAAITVVGGVAYVLLSDDKRPAPRVVCHPGEYVGAPGYQWPYAESFFDPNGFGQALESLGYDAGNWSSLSWSPCDGGVKRAVTQFQSDFNLVRPTREDDAPEATPMSGLIDEPTIEALVYAHNLQVEGLSWPLLVGETRASA